MKFETIEQLKAYAETMPVEKTLAVGPFWANHSRAVYQIGLVQILIDTIFPHNVFKDSNEWYWTGDNMSKEQAQTYAKKYNAKVEEAYYQDDYDKDTEYQIIFNEMNDLLQWIFDTKYSQINA
jgi:hypothetical protein